MIHLTTIHPRSAPIRLNPPGLRSHITRILLLIFFTHAAQAQHLTCNTLVAGKQKIFYCEQGAGPAVILIHPGFLDMHTWDQQVDSLSRHHRVVRIDLSGHGLSQGVDTTIRIAELIRRLMLQLNIKTASFAGISLGASCVIDFAIAHPSMVNRIVLCSPGLNGWEDIMQKDTLSKRAYVRPDTYLNTANPELTVENYIHYWLDGPYRDNAAVDASVRSYLSTTALDKLKRKPNPGPVFDKRKAAKRVQQIRKPTLILYGAQDIPFTAKVASYLVKRIKGAEMHAVEGAHFFMLEKPALFYQYLERWLR